MELWSLPKRWRLWSRLLLPNFYIDLSIVDLQQEWTCSLSELSVRDRAVELIRKKRQISAKRSSWSTYNSLELFLFISNLLKDDFIRRLRFLISSPMSISCRWSCRGMSFMNTSHIVSTWQKRLQKLRKLRRCSANLSWAHLAFWALHNPILGWSPSCCQSHIEFNPL